MNVPPAAPEPSGQVGTADGDAGSADPARPWESRAVLSRDLSQFLVDRSIALHRQAMYPPGHPSLVPALQTLIRRADALLEDRSRFVIGVARDRLVIDGLHGKASPPWPGRWPN